MTRFSLFLGVVAALAGCSRETPTPSATTPNITTPTSALGAGAPSAATPHSTAETTPATALDRMDTRAPVPLLPMMANHQKQSMRDHLVAVQEIVAALSSDDFAGVERAAERIGLSERMGQMCHHMGAGAAGFTKQALDFHHTADQIAVAARDRNRARALSALSATLQACTSCHATWKQRVVDEATWRRLTASAPP